MLREQRDADTPTTFDLRFDRAGQEADEAEHQDVEHQPDDELVGRQPVAHVGLDGSHDQTRRQPRTAARPMSSR